MNVSIITDVRIYEHEGHYYAGSAFYKILERYSKAFGRVTLITRIIKINAIPKDYNEIDSFCADFINVRSITSVAIHLNNDRINDAVLHSDLVILRLPSLISILLYKYVKRNRKVYLTEAMGCAWDAFWNHSLMGKLIAPYAFCRMKYIIHHANYATYVTNSFLQKRYPCNCSSIGVSNVNIEKIYKPKNYAGLSKNRINLLTAAALDVRYKGQQYMIKAIRILEKRGIQCNYYLAGGGSADYLQKIARKNGVEKSVHFLGSVSHTELLKKMREIDFYIQPSLQEGLPRSVIEAMSCGCVCFGSNTAGIPELLNSEQVFKRKKVVPIADTIINTIRNSDLYQISKQNTERAKSYLHTSLDEKRFKYYATIKQGVEGGHRGQ